MKGKKGKEKKIHEENKGIRKRNQRRDRGLADWYSAENRYTTIFSPQINTLETGIKINSGMKA